MTHCMLLSRVCLGGLDDVFTRETKGGIKTQSVETEGKKLELQTTRHFPRLGVCSFVHLVWSSAWEIKDFWPSLQTFAALCWCVVRCGHMTKPCCFLWLTFLQLSSPSVMEDLNSGAVCGNSFTKTRMVIYSKYTVRLFLLLARFTRCTSVENIKLPEITDYMISNDSLFLTLV